MSKVALIFGATGIVGSTIAESLAKTSSSEWSKIIVTSRRKPQLETQDPRITFLSLDLESTDEAGIQEQLISVGGKEVTHLYFTAYIHVKSWDGAELCEKNTPIFTKALKAVDTIAPNLQRVVLQLGAKYYGVHVSAWKGPYPVVEDAGRHPPIEGNPDFYFEQEDFLISLQKGKKWTYTTTRPSHIIGVTRGNGMSIAPTLALYFLIQKELGKKVAYPGTLASYKGICDVSDAELLGEFSIFASTNPQAENQAFNTVSHSSIHETWEQQWKTFGEYFGVETEGATESSSFSLQEYMKDKKPVWESYVKKHGGDVALFDYATWDFADAICGMNWQVGPFSMEKAKKIGWNKETTATNSYIKVFDKLKRLQFLPNKL